MTDHRANPQDGIAIALTALTEFDRYADDGGPVDRNVGRVYGLLRNALADWKLRELHHFETEQENAQLVGYKEEYQRLKAQLATPPAGWYMFGTHVDVPDVRLEFWGDEGGVPIWERPAD